MFKVNNKDNQYDNQYDAFRRLLLKTKTGIKPSPIDLTWEIYLKKQEERLPLDVYEEFVSINKG